MKWLLILWLHAGYITTIEFHDQLSCELALAAVRKADVNRRPVGPGVHGVCVSNSQETAR